MPPLMVDPHARGLAMPVRNKQVEKLGLKRLTFAQARDLGWDYIELCVLDLTDTSILEDPSDPQQIQEKLVQLTPLSSSASTSSRRRVSSFTNF